MPWMRNDTLLSCLQNSQVLKNKSGTQYSRILISPTSKLSRINTSEEIKTRNATLRWLNCAASELHWPHSHSKCCHDHFHVPVSSAQAAQGPGSCLSCWVLHLVVPYHVEWQWKQLVVENQDAWHWSLILFCESDLQLSWGVQSAPAGQSGGTWHCYVHKEMHC